MFATGSDRKRGRKMTKLPGKVGSSEQDVAAFLRKAKEVSAAGPGQGRLVFAMDATMSRQPTWDRALSIQGNMFSEAKKVGQLQVQLVYFRGSDECRASRWVSDPEALGRLMTAVDCRGGYTQVGRVIKHVKSEVSRSGPVTAVFVGDAFEEGIDDVSRVAGELGMLGARLFMFQEGNDGRVEMAFREIARLAGGAYHRLDDSSPAILAELLGAVAAYAAGGQAALESRSKSSDAGRMLLAQLK